MGASFAVWILASVIIDGLGQSNNPYYSTNMWADPFRYQMMPAVPASTGSDFIRGGRILGAVKAMPVQYPKLTSGQQDIPSYSHLLSQPATHNAPLDNREYYTGNVQPSYLSSNIMSSPASEPYYYPLSPVTTATPSSVPSTNSFGQPSFQSSQVSPGYSPGPGSSFETYREALSLFSEVVRKLGKEAGGSGFGLMNKYRPSLLSNAIQGHAGGFPPLDDIMGPDFLQRAHKLYNKIIAEQNYKSAQALQPSHQGFSFPSISGGRKYLANGLNYLTGFMKPSRNVDSGNSYSYYNRPSPYSRSMNVDHVTSESAMQRSMLDAVKSLESNIQRQILANQLVSDDMITSESRFVPQFQYSVQKSTPIPVIPSPSPTPLQSDEELPPRSHVSSTTTMQTLPEPIPLNKNDFIEHPLPYHEYEQLIRDIALNH